MNVPSEGQTLDIDKAFERLETKETETPAESSTETTEVQKPSESGENTISETKPEPFHKHPRWIATQKELKDARDRIAVFEKQSMQSKPTEIPEWWKKQYGDTDESKQRYQAVVAQGGELEWIKNQVLSEIEQKTVAEQNATKQGEEYVETQLSEMTDEGLKFERNKLLKFMVDFQGEYGAGSLVDDAGNYDFRKSLKLMNQLQPEEIDQTSAARKQVAAQAGAKKVSAATSKGVPVVSSRGLRRGNWRDAETGQYVNKSK